MDPNATVKRILGALADGDFDGMEEAIGDLATWIQRGGFFPNGWTRDETVALLRAVRIAAAEGGAR